jgi:hypothetical protein
VSESPEGTDQYRDSHGAGDPSRERERPDHPNRAKHALSPALSCEGREGIVKA